MRTTTNLISAALAVAAAGVVTAHELCDPLAEVSPAAASVAGEPSLAAVRAAAERFTDVAVAEAEGFGCARLASSDAPINPPRCPAKRGYTGP